MLDPTGHRHVEREVLSVQWHPVMMSDVAMDHVVIHIDDWDACHAFYVDVLGFERVENPEGRANPLGSWAYRVGGQQINVHGPWPGRSEACCPPPLNEVGRADSPFALLSRLSRTLTDSGPAASRSSPGPSGASERGDGERASTAATRAATASNSSPTTPPSHPTGGRGQGSDRRCRWCGRLVAR